MKKCIILANGNPPKKSTLKYFAKQGYNTLYCADGGANFARKLGLIPDFIIGDFDSISDETKLFYKKKSKIIHIKSQDDTDVEKCIKHAIKNGYREALLTGVTGDRLDHTLCNLSIVIKYFERIKMIIAAERSLLKPVNGLYKFQSIPGENISLYGFNRRTKISTKGLKYKITNDYLPFGEKEGTSNIATEDSVTMYVTGGIIFVIRELDKIIKNDIFRFS